MRKYNWCDIIGVNAHKNTGSQFIYIKSGKITFRGFFVFSFLNDYYLKYYIRKIRFTKNVFGEF